MNQNGIPPAAQTEPAPAPPSDRRWYHRAGAILFVMFCIELGAVLVMLPWSEFYDRNVLIYLRPGWTSFFLGYPFRGALSGIGCLNFLVAIYEIADWFRRPAAK
jgi:hypothetical protein